MRPALILCLLLTACGEPASLLAAATNIAVVPIFGRTLPDMVYSAAAGRDCSMVRVEQGKTWCREAGAEPKPQPFCTRSLGTVDCWISEAAQPSPPRRGVADGARPLSPTQERDRTQGWLGTKLDPAPER